MSNDRDLLRRSMAAAPEQWLDRLVADRVMAEVERQCSASAQGRSRRSRRGPLLVRARLRSVVAPLRALLAPLRALLARLLPPSAQPLHWSDGDQEG